VFITFDGTEGVGKSSQAKLLSQWLDSQQIKHILTKEPGSIISKECQQIRKLLLSPENNITLRAELWLFLADRSQHVEQIIKPTLGAGKWVISDRYSDSTKVYQVYARGLDMAEVGTMIDYASYNLTPDLTFILDLPVEIGLMRAKQSNTEFVGGDRMERESLDFHKKLRGGFLDISKTHKRYIIINAEGNLGDVHKNVVKEIKKRCKI